MSSSKKGLRCLRHCNGETLQLVDYAYASPRPFDIVTQDTTLREVFQAASHFHRPHLDSWPLEWIRVTIGDETYVWPRLLKLQGHLRTPVMKLCDTNADEIVVFIHFAHPENFQDPEAAGLCLCNFGGCCRLCYAPGARICPGCGNKGSCRCNNCGCSCCDAVEKGLIREVLPAGFPRLLCPVYGCRQAWAEMVFTDYSGEHAEAAGATKGGSMAPS